MIDAGDGATEQLAKAGMPLASLEVLVLTHLHFDHTGGLFAVMTERYRTGAPGVLTIYGPPGTEAMVEDLLAAMKPTPPFGFASPAKEVKVIEVNGGTSLSVGAVKVNAVRNSHLQPD